MVVSAQHAPAGPLLPTPAVPPPLEDQAHEAASRGRRGSWAGPRAGCRCACSPGTSRHRCAASAGTWGTAAGPRPAHGGHLLGMEKISAAQPQGKEEKAHGRWCRTLQLWQKFDPPSPRWPQLRQHRAAATGPPPPAATPPASAATTAPPLSQSTSRHAGGTASAATASESAAPRNQRGRYCQQRVGGTLSTSRSADQQVCGEGRSR